MDAAVRLEDEVSSGLHELVRTVAQEEVAQQHLNSGKKARNENQQQKQGKKRKQHRVVGAVA